jgi:hypothetical protein
MRWLLIPIFCLLCYSAYAGNFSIMAENDLAFKTDRAYTHGTRFSYKLDEVPEWIEEVLPTRDNEVSFALAQHLYSPSDTAIKEYMPNDRPYAGWLYVGANLSSRDGDWQDFIEIDVGTVGPNSFGEETQTFVHKITKSQRPEGWQWQIKNEPGIDIAYDKKHKSRWENFIDIDLVTYGGGCVGNIATFCDIGSMLRIGYNVPDDFGYVRMEPAPRIFDNFVSDFSCYLFGIVEKRYILRNIFLDGNTFVESSSIEKESIVNDYSYGLGIAYKKFEILIGNTYRSKEFKLQERANKFTTLMISFSI